MWSNGLFCWAGGNGVLDTSLLLLDQATLVPKLLITGLWLPEVPFGSPLADLLTSVVVFVTRLRSQTLVPFEESKSLMRSSPMELNTTIGASAAIIGSLAPPTAPLPTSGFWLLRALGTLV